MKRCKICGERFNPGTYRVETCFATSWQPLVVSGRYCGRCEDELRLALDEERETWDDDEERGISDGV